MTVTAPVAPIETRREVPSIRLWWMWRLPGVVHQAPALEPEAGEDQVVLRASLDPEHLARRERRALLDHDLARPILDVVDHLGPDVVQDDTRARARARARARCGWR